MKVIVSSKCLCEKLERVDFEHDPIMSVMLVDGELCLLTGYFVYRIECVAEAGENTCFNQRSEKWESLICVLSDCEDQPVTLHIGEDILILTMSL